MAHPVKRVKSVKVTDKRIRIMNEVIVGIRVIKMYAWEYAFKKVVSKLRRLVVNNCFNQKQHALHI